MKRSVLATWLLIAMGSSGGAAAEPPPIYDGISPVEAHRVDHAFLNPTQNRLVLSSASTTLVIDGTAEALHLANDYGSVSVSLDEVARAYASYYGEGRAEVARKFLDDMRADLRDPAQLYSWVFDHDRNGQPNEYWNDPHNGCQIICDRGYPHLDRTLFNFRGDYWQNGFWGNEPPRRPPPEEREKRRNDCKEEARSIKSDVDNAFVAWGLTCMTAGRARVLGGGGCVASGGYAAKKTGELFRKVKECEAL